MALIEEIGLSAGSFVQVIDAQATPGAAPGVWNDRRGTGVGVGADLGDSASVAVTPGVALGSGPRDAVMPGDCTEADGPPGPGLAVKPAPHPPMTAAIKPAAKSVRIESRRWFAAVFISPPIRHSNGRHWTHGQETLGRCESG
jgi:hypothetical protein